MAGLVNRREYCAVWVVRAAIYIRIYSLHKASENALTRVIYIFSRSERARECVTCGSRAGGHVAADERGAGLRVQQQADVIAGRCSAGAAFHLPGPAGQSAHLHLGRARRHVSRGHAQGLSSSSSSASSSSSSSF